MAVALNNRLCLENPKNSGLKKGDEVIVISGSHKGKKAKIERFDRKNNRVYVAGLNIAKRHTRANASNQSGGIIDKQMSIHLSNVMFWDEKAKKPSRVSYKVEGKKKVRVAQKSKTVLS